MDANDQSCSGSWGLLWLTFLQYERSENWFLTCLTGFIYAASKWREAYLNFDLGLLNRSLHCQILINPSVFDINQLLINQRIWWYQAWSDSSCFGDEATERVDMAKPFEWLLLIFVFHSQMQCIHFMFGIIQFPNI